MEPVLTNRPAKYNARGAVADGFRAVHGKPMTARSHAGGEERRPVPARVTVGVRQPSCLSAPTDRRHCRSSALSAALSAKRISIWRRNHPLGMPVPELIPEMWLPPGSPRLHPSAQPRVLASSCGGTKMPRPRGRPAPGWSLGLAGRLGRGTRPNTGGASVIGSAAVFGRAPCVDRR